MNNRISKAVEGALGAQLSESRRANAVAAAVSEIIGESAAQEFEAALAVAEADEAPMLSERQMSRIRSAQRRRAGVWQDEASASPPSA